MASRVYVIELTAQAGRRRARASPGSTSAPAPATPRSASTSTGAATVGGPREAICAAPAPDLYDDLPPFKGSKAAQEAETARARELAACGFVAHSDGTSYGKDGGDWAEWDSARLNAVGAHVDAAASELLESAFEALSADSVRPPAPRRARVLGPRLPRPGRRAARVRAVRARATRGARGSGRGARIACWPVSISVELGERRTVDLPEGTIEYRERGEGRPLVFIHGVGVNGDLWRKVVPGVSGECRCIAPDLPLGAHSTLCVRALTSLFPGWLGSSPISWTRWSSRTSSSSRTTPEAPSPQWPGRPARGTDRRPRADLVRCVREVPADPQRVPRSRRRGPRP